VAQIALPYRIALVAGLVFAVAWFAVLRPSDDAENAPPPQAPGVEGLKTSIGKANAASATSDAANAARQAAAAQASGEAPPATGATPSAATPSAAGALPTPGAAPAKSSAATALETVAEGDPSSAILRELAAGKTAVVLFSSPLASDDRRVRRQLRRIDRHSGAVKVHSIAIADVARYDAITRGVQVTQAPTLLIVGEDLKARRIVGYTDRTEINQVVNDISGLRARLRPSSYKALVQRGCGTTVYNINGDRASLADRDIRVLAFRDDVQALAKRLRGASVPARYGAFNTQYVRYLTDVDRTLARLTPRSPESAYRTAISRLNQLDNRIHTQAAGTGLRCAA